MEKLIEKKLADGEKQKTSTHTIMIIIFLFSFIFLIQSNCALVMFSTPPPPSYIPTVVKDKLQLTDMNSEEIARQVVY